MNWLLDSNAISHLLRGNLNLRQRYDEAQANGDGFVLSPVVDFEIRRYLDLKGATRNLRQYEALVQHWFPATFDTADWRRAAVLWAERHRVGRGIEDADLLIAVTTLRHDAHLVTNNTRHFDGLTLTVADWSLS